MPTRVCLIVPCFNEAGRLDIAQFAAPPDGVTCLLVDDGSRDSTRALLERHASARLRVLPLPRHVGKAEAVRQGMLHARDTGLTDDAAWVGYWDADLATPLSEIAFLLEYAALDGGRVDGVLGSRVNRLGSRITRSARRHLLGRAFTTAAVSLVGVTFYDSQCGAKLLRTELVQAAFGEPFVSRWIFDVEILLRLREHRLIECPLREWTDVPRGTFSVVMIAVPTVLDLCRIRRRYRTARDERE